MRIFIVIGAALMVWTLCAIDIMKKEVEQKQKIEQIDGRISTAERKLVMLHTCFPKGHYKGDAAPECPAFLKFIMSDAYQIDPETQQHFSQTTKGTDHAN